VFGCHLFEHLKRGRELAAGNRLPRTGWENELMRRFSWTISKTEHRSSQSGITFKPLNVTKSIKVFIPAWETTMIRSNSHRSQAL
jgi:hypothetical protein